MNLFIKMNSPVTQKDVAAKAGVERSTVSRALNSDPSIPQKTRTHIQSVARKMGYRPNLSSQTLAKQRYAKTLTPETVAYIGILPLNVSPAEVERYDRRYADYLSNLTLVAKRYNLKLDAHKVHTQKQVQQLCRTLWNRGIRGVIFGPLVHPWVHEVFEWDRFVSVCCTPNYAPPAHRISLELFESVMNCYEPTFGSGYQRVGFVLLTHDFPIRDDQIILSAFKYFQQEKAPYRVPLFRVNQDEYVRLVQGTTKELKMLERWVTRNNLQAVIGYNGAVHYALAHGLGACVPDEIAFATLTGVPRKKNLLGLSGNLCHLKSVSETAIKILIQQLHANAYGLPPYYVDMKIHSEWHKGRTLPPRKTTHARE